MKQLKALAQKTETAQQIIKDKIYKGYPVIENISIYGANNIRIESEHFNIDLYEGRTYTETSIRMSCKMEATQIPTEEEAIAQIKTLKLERTKFIKAFIHVRDKVLNDCIETE